MECLGFELGPQYGRRNRIYWAMLALIICRRSCSRDRSRSVWPDGFNIIQSLAIYNKDNFPSSIKMPKWVQKFAKYKINHPIICPNTFIFLTKWRNFSKSGHAVTNQYRNGYFHEVLVKWDTLKNKMLVYLLSLLVDFEMGHSRPLFSVFRLL